MGRRSDYKKDRAWDAWDMNCRSICPVKSKRRRALRDKLRRMQRKRISRIIEYDNGETVVVLERNNYV